MFFIIVMFIYNTTKKNINFTLWHVTLMQIYLWETRNWEVDSKHDGEWGRLLPP